MANRTIYALVSGKPVWLNSQNETIDFSMVNLGTDPSSNNHAVRRSYVATNYINVDKLGVLNGVATLDPAGKIPATQLPNEVMSYKGNWDASTNSPNLDGIAGVTAQRGIFTSSPAGSIWFYALIPGVAGNDISIEFVNDGVAGSETVGVAGNAITVHIQSEVSTTAQVKTAVDNTPAAAALVTTYQTSNTPVVTTAAINLQNGADAINYPPNAGDVWKCSVAGEQDLNNTMVMQQWNVGDWAVYSGTIWEWSPAGAVASVNGDTGVVVLATDDIAETLQYPSDSIAFTTGALSAQGDFVVIDPGSPYNYAMWLDKDSNGTEPTAAAYLAVPVGRRIKVSITSGQTKYQVAYAFAMLIPYDVGGTFVATGVDPSVINYLLSQASTTTAYNADGTGTSSLVITRTVPNHANNMWFTDARAKAAAVADAINNGVTDVAPSQNAVFDALALKLDASSLVHTFNTTTGVAAGDLCYISGANVVKAQANAIATCSKKLVIALATVVSGSVDCLVSRGKLVTGYTGLSVGDPVYLDTAVAGAVITAQPSTVGQCIVVVGEAITSDTFEFNPQLAQEILS